METKIEIFHKELFLYRKPYSTAPKQAHCIKWKDREEEHKNNNKTNSTMTTTIIKQQQQYKKWQGNPMLLFYVDNMERVVWLTVACAHSTSQHQKPNEIISFYFISHVFFPLFLWIFIIHSFIYFFPLPCTLSTEMRWCITRPYEYTNEESKKYYRTLSVNCVNIFGFVATFGCFFLFIAGRVCVGCVWKRDTQVLSFE